MLRVRRGGLGTAMGAAASVLEAVSDRLIASDPGLLRLMMATRGTLAVLLTTLASIGLGRLLGAPPTEFAAGITFSLMAPFLMREPSLRQRQRTLAMLTFPTIAATVATTVLHGQGQLGDMFFLVLVFLAFLFQARSPRAIGVGLVAVIVSYIGLYLELPVASLPIQILSVFLAAPVTGFACFVLVPMRPVATLWRTVQAVRRRAALVLHDAGSLDAGERGTVRRLRGSLARLNEVALAADDQLTLLYPVRSAPLRRHLMDLELAAARLAAAPLDGTPLDPAHPDGGRRRVSRLLIHERRLRHNRWTARHSQSTAVPPSPASNLAAGLADIARAAAALGQAAADLPVAAAPQAAPPSTPGPLAWRVALRVTLASSFAIAGGMAVSPQRWFWAVITTYVVFLNTRSRGDTMLKGVQRLGGTVLGLVAGLTLASVLEGSGVATVGVLLAAVFGMYYLFLVSYTLGIFCVTVLLGLLYSLLGASMEPLLLLRLEETAIGAAAAVVVAFYVFPLRTRDQVSQSGTAVLRALADVVGVCRRALAGDPDALPVPAMRAVDRQVADLRSALLPLTVGRLVLRRFDRERPVAALLDCVHWARMLAVAAHAPDPAAAARTASIEACLRALAAGERPILPRHAAVGGTAASVALDELEQATEALAERLAISALHAFQLDGMAA